MVLTLRGFWLLWKWTVEFAGVMSYEKRLCRGINSPQDVFGMTIVVSSPSSLPWPYDKFYFSKHEDIVNLSWTDMWIYAEWDTCSVLTCLQSRILT